MELKDLVRKVEISEFDKLESEHMYDVESDENITIINNKLPFGKSYFIWRDMKNQVLNQIEKCEIWEYEFGGYLSMRAGLVLVKDDKWITGWNIVLRMS